MGKGNLSYRKELIDFLVTYDFPGNVRELQSFVHDLVSRTENSRLSTSLLKSIIVRERDNARPLPDQEKTDSSPVDDSITFSSFPTLRFAEDYLIDRALEIARNNQGNAASMLGLTRQALNNRLRRNRAKTGT